MAFIIYLLLFTGLVYFNGFFNLFTDDRITKKQFSLLLFLKCLAVPVFYVIFSKTYGGIEKFDTGKFFNDVQVINAFARQNFVEYVKLVFGLQDDSPGSYIHSNCLTNTMNWDNGTMKDYLYNDNRVLIRIHSLLGFIAFGSWFVHALFSCVLSFIGIVMLYKCFKEFFQGKEMWFVMILCFFPSLWLYTGAFLKEGLTVFFMGCLLYRLKRTIYGERSTMGILWLIFLLFISLLLKPYILFFSAICFGLYFFIYQSEKTKHKFLIFIAALVFFGVALNVASLLFKGKSLPTAAMDRQRIFAGAAKGGIFLADDFKFVQLKYDTSLIERIEGTKDLYHIKKNAPYTYWEDSHQKDTLYNAGNHDTLARYELVDMSPPGASNIDIDKYSGIGGIFYTLYISLFDPFFINAKNMIQVLASIENLMILIALLLVMAGLIRSQRPGFLPLLLIVFSIGVCLLIGYTSPNTGAILRYRCPVVFFILLAGLYYVDENGITRFKMKAS